MRAKSMVLVLLLVIVAAAAFFFFATQDESGGGAGGPRAGTSADAKAPDAPAAEARKRSARTGNRWVQIGEGDVTGIVREYGSEKPLGGLAVTLVASDAGPERTLTATTRADGSFDVAHVPNFEDWTLRVDAPDPLADVELGGVNVVENRRTDLGVVYVTPAFGIEGTVVDEAGAPIEGADVRMLRSSTGGSQMDILRLIREIHIEPPAVDRATSDAAGHFRLGKTVPGSYDVKVVRRGRRVHVERGLLVTPQSSKSPLRFVLEKGFQLEGRVVRNGPGAIEGIRISAFHQPGDDDFLVLDRVFATTDAEGKFVVDGLGAGRHVVAAIPEGEPFKFSDDVQIPARGPIEIVLESDAWLEGRVTGNGGAAVAGANIYVARFKGSRVVGTARTDGEGKYSIRGLSSGPVEMFLVQAEGYATWPTDLLQMMRGKKQQGETLVQGRNEKNVSLELGGTVTGVVRVQGTEEPIAGVRVEMVSILAMFGGGRGATTDAAGRFELTSVPLGESFLVLSKDGWFQPGVSPMTVAMGIQMGGRGSKTPADPGKGPRIAIADPGMHVERVFEMSRGSTVSGQVLSPDGKPVAGARVQLVAEAGAMDRMLDAFTTFFGSSDPSLSDADGRFRVSGPPPGQKARVVAKAQGWLDGRSDPVTAAAGDALADLVVKLRQGASVEGAVTDERNRPLVGALVRWATVDAQNEWQWQWQLRNAQPTLTDTEGRYRIAGVETGKIAVSVSHPQYLESLRKDLTAEEGRAIVVDVKLALGAFVVGKVSGPDGKPVTGVSVSMSPVDQDDANRYRFGNDDVTTDAQGAFRAEGLAAGTWSFQARREGFAPSDSVKVAVESGGEVALRLHPAYRISGVVRAAGQPAANAVVQLFENRAADAGEPNAAASGNERRNVDNERTDATGHFAFEGVREGVYEIEARPGWWGEDRANILPKSVKDVRAGTENVAIDCEAGLSITGKAFLPDGSPVPGGEVNATRVRTDDEGWDNSDSAQVALADGAFELVGLKPGKWSVSVDAPGYATKQLVAEAGARELRFQLAAGGKVAGRVLDPEGRPAARVWVQAQNSDGNKGAETNDEGRYEIGGLPAGPVTVTANQWDAEDKKPRTAASAPVEVRVDLTTNVPDMTLQAVKQERHGDDDKE